MYRADERSAVCTAVRCTVSEDVALEGVVIRSEQLLRSDPAPGVSAVPGERLAADSAVAFAGDEPVMTRRSAVFFDDTDGYEYLSPGALTGLTSGGLEELLRARPETASDAYGRLVTGFDWYYAAAPAQRKQRPPRAPDQGADLWLFAGGCHDEGGVCCRPDAGTGQLLLRCYVE